MPLLDKHTRISLFFFSYTPSIYKFYKYFHSVYTCVVETSKPFKVNALFGAILRLQSQASLHYIIQFHSMNENWIFFVGINFN